MDARRSFLNDPTVYDWELFIDGMLEEAAKSEVPVFTWLSPSFKGKGEDYLDPEYFRYQLETLVDKSDGILLWNPDVPSASNPENHAWFEVLDEFMTSLQTPTQFTINVQPHSDSRDGNAAPFQSGEQYVVSDTDDDQSGAFAPGGFRMSRTESTPGLEALGVSYSSPFGTQIDIRHLRRSLIQWGGQSNDGERLDSERQAHELADVPLSDRSSPSSLMLRMQAMLATK